MPKAAQRERRATSNERRFKVWRFVDYEGRFGCDLSRLPVELPQFIKWYINAWDGEGGEVVTAIDQLRGEKDFIWLQGAVIELLKIATNRRQYRGYLVTGSLEPMEASEVGSVLRVDGRRARVVLTRLERVGFLERVAWPPEDWDGEIVDDPSLRLLQDVARASEKRAPTRGRNRRSRAEKRGPPFNKPEESEKAAAQQTVEGAPAVAPDGGGAAQGRGLGGAEPPKAAQGPPGGGRMTCPRCGHVGKGPKAGQAGQCTQCGTLVTVRNASPPRPPTTPDAAGQGRGQQARQHDETATPDAGAGREGSRRLAAAEASNRRPMAAGPSSPTVVRIGDVLGGQRHRYSRAGNEFAARVLAAAGYGDEDRTEAAHWAKLWERCCGQLDECGRQRVVEKILRLAGQIRTGQVRKDNPLAWLQACAKNAVKDGLRRRARQSG